MSEIFSSKRNQNGIVFVIAVAISLLAGLTSAQPGPRPSFSIPLYNLDPWMVPFRIKTDVYITQFFPDDTNKTQYFDPNDFNMVIIPNSCHTVLKVERLDLPNLD